MKLHELTRQQITALKLVMVRMGVWEGDLDGNFSVAFGHAFNRMQNRLGVEVNSTYTSETDAALQAFWQFTTAGDYTWNLDSGGVVDQQGRLVEEWAQVEVEEVLGSGTTTPPDPVAPDVDEDELPEEQGMTAEERRNYRADAIGYLRQFGLDTRELRRLIDRAIEEGWSSSTFELEVKESESFKLRFPYYEALNQRGTPMSIPQLVDYERGIIEALQRYGLSDIYQIPSSPFRGGVTGGGGGGGGGGTGSRGGGGASGPGRDIGVDDRYVGPNPYPDGYTTGNPTPGGTRPGQRDIGDPYGGDYTAGGAVGGTRPRPGDRNTDNPPAGTYAGGASGSASGSGSGSGGGSGGSGGGGGGGSSDRSLVDGLPGIVGSEVQELIGELLANDVSVREVTERLGRGYATVYNQDPAIQQFFASAYGAAGEAALAAYFLDPDIDAEVLFDRAETAVIGGTSTMAFGDETINLMRAERLQSVGYSQAQAWQTFTQLNELGALFTETIGEQTDFTKSEEGVDALAGLTPEGMRTLERRRRSRVAGFSGGGGFAAGNEGIAGFGTSSS